MAESLTISSVLKRIKEQLEQAKLRNPQLEAEMIVSEALGISRPEIYLELDKTIPGSALKKIRAWVKARSERKPFAYIIRKAWFREIELEVNNSVLIPRPETELLTEQALRIIRSEPTIEKILDLGTGSGAIILSLAFELKNFARNLKFFASDISKPALELAKKNARKLGLSKKITFCKGDLFQPFSRHKFHLIVCNPPYIPQAQLRSLMPEIKRYEPEIALNGGIDGLELIQKIINQAPRHLYPDAWLLMEIGLNQAKRLKKYLGAEMALKEVVKDYNRVDRIAIFQKRQEQGFARILT